VTYWMGTGNPIAFFTVQLMSTIAQFYCSAVVKIRIGDIIMYCSFYRGSNRCKISTEVKFMNVHFRLRFLGIILLALKLDVSVWIS
jgi:hypothetical protein